MKGIILAAGRGSRMGSLTNDHPKCQTVIKGKKLIEWQFDAFKEAGIHEISIVRGYMSGCFDYDLKYFENKRWKNTNMVVSLLTASEWLRSNVCIVSYSDIIYSSNTIDLLIKKDRDIVVAYDPNWEKIWKLRFEDPLSDAESFKLDGEKIIEIGKKSVSIDSIEGQYMGIMKFTPEKWIEIENYLLSIDKRLLDCLDMTTLLQHLITNGMSIYASPVNDKWFEFDHQNDLDAFKNFDKI